MKVCKNPAENTIFGGSGAPRRPQIRPEMAPKTAQEASKTAQEAPKTAQEAPKTAQEAPRTAQEAPKTAQEAHFGGSGAGNLHFPRFFEGPGGGRREASRPKGAGMAVWWPLGGTMGG